MQLTKNPLTGLDAAVPYMINKDLKGGKDNNTRRQGE